MKSIMLIAAVVLLAGSARAQDLYIYPNEGQDAEKQEFDEFQCHKWAKDQSGVDPGAPPPDPNRGNRARGAAGGAIKTGALGAAVGGIAGGSSGAKKGAAAGAVVGAVGGRNRAVNQEKRQQAGQRNSFQRAFAACMEARGYTVR